MNIEWTFFKQFVDSRSLSIQWIDDGTTYWLKAIDGYFTVDCILHKNDLNDSLADFETNYKANGNKKLSASSDSENATIHRMKTAPTGWTYHAHGFEFKTAELNSVYNNKHDGTSYNFVTYNLYDANDVLITDQLVADTDCVKTVVDFEPTHDYELISGRAYVKNDINGQDVRLWVIGVPDVPEAYGGSKIMVSGVNMDYIDEYQPLTTDGRVSKRMNYSAINHSNKLRFIIKHPAGLKVNLMILMEMYKA